MNTVDDMIQDAIGALIEADDLMCAFPAEQQQAWRALVSGLVGIGQAVAESHKEVLLRLDARSPSAAPPRPNQPLSMGME